MASHVIRDRIWESKKLRACSKLAALAYPWIFLVADDHGRFEYEPRRIWTKVFGSRSDVELSEVTGWLEEYWRVGLLIRYPVTGELAYWGGFIGRRPSERRQSDIESPEGLAVFDGAGKARRRRAQGAEASRDVRDKSTSVSEIEQSRDRAETERRQRRSRAARSDVADDRAETRSLIDAYNGALNARITYTPGNLRAAARALDGGYTEEHCRIVFEAVRDRSTETAAWCNEANREFEYLVRPPYKHHRTHELTYGPLDKIPNELSTGRKAG